jgi:hypothetical protein
VREITEKRSEEEIEVSEKNIVGEFGHAVKQPPYPAANVTISNVETQRDDPSPPPPRISRTLGERADVNETTDKHG